MAARYSNAFACLILSSALAAPLPASAQPTPRDLTGTVTNGHHEPIAGAIVEVHDEATDSVISYITPRTGRYTFHRLSSNDDYTVSATYRGARSKTRRLSKFDSRPKRAIALVIKSP
jgi:hypothetical protein